MMSLLIADVLTQVAASSQVQLPVDLSSLFTWFLRGLAAVVGTAMLFALKVAIAAFTDLTKVVKEVRTDVTSVKHELFGVSGQNGMRSDVRRSKALLVKHDRLLVKLATREGIDADLDAEEN